MLSSLTIRLSVAAILQQPSNVKAYVCVYVWWMCRGASVCQAWRASCRPRTLGKRNRGAPDSGAEPTHSSHHTHGFSRAPPAVSELYNPTVRNPHAVSDVWLRTGKPLQNINRRIPENPDSCRREALRIHDRRGGGRSGSQNLQRWRTPDPAAPRSHVTRYQTWLKTNKQAEMKREWKS